MRQVLLISFLFIAVRAFPQDMEYAHKVLNDLCADEMMGRGFAEDGDNIAAFYIEQQFKDLGLFAWDFNYYQQFVLPVNTFPGKMEVAVDGVSLVPGQDFIISPDSRSIRSNLDVICLDRLPDISPSGQFLDSNLSLNGALVFPDSLFHSVPHALRPAMLKALKKAGAKAVIRLTDEKLTWSEAKQQVALPSFQVTRNRWPEDAKEVRLNVHADLKKRYRTQNVLAYVEGSENPDRYVVFTAHYDHLGEMGKGVLFRGANDNASGVTMLLNLAKFYSRPDNVPEYSMAFIAFSAEETGLDGSLYYVQNPVFPLEQIAFLVNLDIVGTGDEGITVVNGAVHTEEFKRLKAINDRNSYLKLVKKRGRAAISDHYPFSESGVPSFYIYTMGGSKAYHDIYDVPDSVSFAGFEGLFKLLTDFTETF